MSQGGTDDDLHDRIEALETALRALQADLDTQRTSSRFPRPPSPRDLLRLTETYAIPTAIAFLEAHIRALELLRATIRVTANPRDTGGRPQQSHVYTRLAEEIDSLVDGLQTGRIPTGSNGDDVLADARALRDEIRDHIDNSGEAANFAPEDEQPLEPLVDVEEELRSIRAELEEDTAPDEDGDGTGDEDDDQSSTGAN